MKKFLYGSVGAVLVLSLTTMSVAPAFAQDLTPPAALRSTGTTTVPMTQGASPSAYTGNSGQSMSPEEVARVMAFAQANGVAPFTLTPGDRDEFGRPRSISAIEASQRLGGIDGLRLAQGDDRQFCSVLADMESLEMQIHAFEAQVQAADLEAANAQTRAERRQAEAKASRVRTNFFQFVLTLVRVGVVSFIPGVGWAYGAYVLGSEVSAWLSRNQHNREMEANDARVAADAARVHAFELRLKALDMRLQLSDMQNKLFRVSMGSWCGAMGYTVRSSTTSYSYTPSQ